VSAAAGTVLAARDRDCGAAATASMRGTKQSNATGVLNMFGLL